MSEVVITSNDLNKSIKSKISKLYWKAYGQDVDIETLKITISTINQLCLYCVNYDEDKDYVYSDVYDDSDDDYNDEGVGYCLIDNDLKNRSNDICEHFESGVVYPKISCMIDFKN